jgi:NarL family two-component system response regulator LiaR
LNVKETIKVMIVDDHLMVRDGLKVFLSIHDDLEVIAEAEDGQQAIALCPQVQPDVILMDVVMPNIDGPTATAQIRADYPEVQVIALTTFSEKELVQRAIQAGAVGYLLKDVHPDKLAQAIRDAHHGRSTLDAGAAQTLIQAAAELPPPGSNLTPREREVLALLVEGKTNKEIAEELTISQATVRLHVSNILSKLGASNRTEAATLAHQHNLLDIDLGQK